MLIKRGKDYFAHIITSTGRELRAVPVFGEDDFNPTHYKVDEYESIPASSVKEAYIIYDYWYSEEYDHIHGHSTVDGKKFTETKAHYPGNKPYCLYDDVVFVKTTHKGIVKIEDVKDGWDKYTDLQYGIEDQSILKYI